MQSNNTVYKLLDSGNFRKLEQVGPYLLDRPAAQAIWYPALPREFWQKADAGYNRSGPENGHWKTRTKLPESWAIEYHGIRLLIKPTSFGHLGIFPEEGANWSWLINKISARKKETKVLNLFAYTGGSSLAAAKAGAKVTHVDSAKGIVSWARENAKLSGLEDRPVRWIVDDVFKFISREQRRNSEYDAVILSPPSFGRGTKGEVWKFEKDMPDLLKSCRALLGKEPLFVMITSHTPGYSPKAMENLLGGIMSGCRGTVESREMTVPETDSGRLLPNGIIALWQDKKDD